MTDNKILIAERDIFDRLTDAALFYDHMIRHNPELDFIVPVTRETRAPFKNVETVLVDSDPATADSKAFIEGLARAVAGRSFRAVDMASTSPYLHYLRRALQNNRSSADRFCLSLHGWQSDTYEVAWKSDPAAASRLRDQEAAATAAADCVYGFSDVCRNDVLKRYARAMTWVAPADAIGFRQPLQSEWAGPVHIWYVGTLARHERCDLVLPIAAFLTYSGAKLGGVSFIDAEQSASSAQASKDLQASSEEFSFPFNLFAPSADWCERLAKERSVLLVPGPGSFSYAGAQALSCGIPVIANEKNGLAWWLKNDHPSWPLSLTDPIDVRSTGRNNIDLINNYDRWRGDLLTALQKDPPANTTPNFMKDIYQPDRTRFEIIDAKMNNFQEIAAAQAEKIRELHARVDSDRELISNLSYSLASVTQTTESMTSVGEQLTDLAEAIRDLRKKRRSPKLKFFSPREAFRLAKHTWRGRIRNHFLPRLWVFEQYKPRRVVIRNNYRQTLPPNNPPRITMVTPTYNYARYLGATVDSVLSQHYPALDYLVQDGASTDDTVALLKTYGENIRWASEADSGQANAINKGFLDVETDIMGWLNSDDVLLPGTLNYVAKYFADHPKVDIVYGCRVFIDSKGLEVGRYVLPPHDSATLHFTDYIPQETMFWRKKVWDAVGGLDEFFQFAMDWDFILRALDKGFRFKRLPRFLACFRVHDQQKTGAWHDVGQEEQATLRRRWVKPDYVHADIAKAILPYLLRHLAYHWAVKIGVLRF